LVKLVLKTQS